MGKDGEAHFLKRCAEPPGWAVRLCERRELHFPVTPFKDRIDTCKNGPAELSRDRLSRRVHKGGVAPDAYDVVEARMLLGFPPPSGPAPSAAVWMQGADYQHVAVLRGSALADQF